MDSQSRIPHLGLGCLIVLLCFILFVAVFGPTSRVKRGPALRTVCLNDVRQLMLAMQNYESVHGHLPPAYIADENGKPMHSWRVLLLPFIEGDNLFVKYDFDEPWDGPNNSKLAEYIPSMYRCPSDVGDDFNTSYFVITGPGTAFPGKKIRSADLANGGKDTVGIIDASQSSIKDLLSGGSVNWMEPRDITVAQFSAMLENTNSKSLNHETGIVIVFADATAKMLDHTPEGFELDGEAFDGR